jgi:isoleucyl-tRNA synthetase
MEAYDLPKSVRPIAEFIDEFSTWWLRRSRDRFKSDDEKDKKQALITFKYALTELSKVMAPFVPFMAEYLYGQVCAGKESVHLEKWPEAEKKLIDEKLLEQMDQAKKIVEMGLSARADKGIKIRQPLAKLIVHGFNLDKDFGQIIADEVNVKIVEFAKGEVGVELDTEISTELKLEGMIRELVRTINDMRKKQGLTVGDTINVYWQSDSDAIKSVFESEKYSSELKKSTLTSEFINEDGGEEIKVNGEVIKLKIQKI